MPGGMLALSANGNKAGTGILWAVVPLDGDANQQRGVKGIVLALDAQDVSRTLWTSEQFVERDRLGLFAKFTPPTVAGRQGVRRDLWRQRAAPRLCARRAAPGAVPAATTTSRSTAARRRAARRDRGQPGPRRCDGGARSHLAARRWR